MTRIHLDPADSGGVPYYINPPSVSFLLVLIDNILLYPIIIIIMKFTTITTLVYPFLTILSLAVFAAPLESRDVFVPLITYPTAGVTWFVGECYTVTW